MSGHLILIPITLGDTDPKETFPLSYKHTLTSIKYFIVENIRTTRRFLKQVNPEIDIDSLTFYELNKHTDRSKISGYLNAAEKGYDIGMISEAGCPGVADPGAEIVIIAHERKIEVHPLIGPSSILLSLMASGLNGQNFAFVGYLPIKQPERSNYLKKIEKRVHFENQTQLFIETPYRNDKLLQDLTKTLDSKTMLCIACDLTMESEYIKTQSIGQWKKNLPSINKRPAIFLIGKKA